MTKKIISGCQTGADQAGLIAAEKLGLETGGWMPAGYRTATGARKDLAEKYGLKCTGQSSYYQRTMFNVRDSDATIILGRQTSSGSKLTARYAKSLEKPCLKIHWGTAREESVKLITEFLEEVKPQTLNIAGNREEVCPGITDWVVDLLVESLKQQVGVK